MSKIYLYRIDAEYAVYNNGCSPEQQLASDRLWTKIKRGRVQSVVVCRNA